MKILGIILIVVGILTFAVPYVNFTTKEKALDIGPIEVTKTEKHSFPVSPVIGVILTLAGVVVLVTASKK
ncbi:MAG: DUF3185 domain-containing protein [Chthoniobacterales bacterium]